MNDLNNLSYFIHTTLVTDKLNFNVIAEETTKDVVLQEIISRIQKGHSWLPRQDSTMVNKFQQIYPELMVSPKGLLLKGDRIVLPETLQENAMELAHCGSHPRHASMERHLRSHFFFHDMHHKVDNFLKKCKECAAFLSKKTMEPIKPHKVPNKCWEMIAVDLSGPIPLSKHVVVVKDLSSRFPAAKMVTSTSPANILPALGNIYDAYGNPGTQISGNEPPFNLQAMMELMKS